MSVTRRTSILMHAGAILAIALGLWAWDAQGAAIWGDAIFTFCL
ncbi:hypothetical protein [Aureimonas mangrovi]|nr:hypothetical protein [Aureimonas mangrovi]